MGTLWAFIAHLWRLRHSFNLLYICIYDWTKKGEAERWWVSRNYAKTSKSVSGNFLKRKIWHANTIFRLKETEKHETNLGASHRTISMFVCLFVCLSSWRYNPLWLYFHSPVAGFSLLVFEVSWSHDAPQSVGLLWMSDQSVAETSTWQSTTLTTDKHPCPRWDSNP
jgi:hypothetical protein